MLTERGFSFPRGFEQFQNYVQDCALAAFGSDPITLQTNLRLNSMPPLDIKGFDINAWAKENGHTPADGNTRGDTQCPPLP